MNRNAKVYVAGHRGMVGSAIYRKLEKEGFNNLIVKTSNELDLRKQDAVADFFQSEKPEFVFLAAAKVGGIQANNTYRAEFLHDNLMIQNHVIHSSYFTNVKKLLFLGSSCIYPKMAQQPLKEEYILSGFLEATNQPYAIAKIAGIELCDSYRRQYGCNFISAMPTNLYGPNDNYDLDNSHVLPALIRKFHEAKMRSSPHVNVFGTGTPLREFLRKVITAKNNNESYVEIWGSGTPRREFLHADDLAEALFFLMENYNEAGLVNVGVGTDITILELAELIKKIVGFNGEIQLNTAKPDGTPRKLMDVQKINAMGWHAKIGLEAGISMVYEEKKYFFIFINRIINKKDIHQLGSDGGNYVLLA